MRKHLYCFLALLLVFSVAAMATNVAVEITIDDNLKEKFSTTTKNTSYGEIQFKKKVRNLDTGKKLYRFDIPCRVEIKENKNYIFSIMLADKDGTKIYCDIEAYKSNEYTKRAIIPIEITEKIIEMLENNEVPSITINDPSIDPINAMEYKIGHKKHPAILKIQFGNRPIR